MIPSLWTPRSGFVPTFPSYWDSADKSSNVTLTNSDKTASVGAFSSEGVYGLGGKRSSEKVYCEYHIVDAPWGRSTEYGMGIGSKSVNTFGTKPGDENNEESAGVFNDGTTARFDRTNITLNPTLGTFVNGDVCMIALDRGTGEVWFGRNGTWAGVGGVTGDPGAGTTPTASGLKANLTLYPLLSGHHNSVASSSITLAATAAECTYSAPSGFDYWDEANTSTGTKTIGNTGVTHWSGSATTRTISSASLGAAQADRHVIVFAHAIDGATVFTASSCTAGGVSATKACDSGGATITRGAAIFCANVPSGTTGNISVTWSEAIATGQTIGWMVVYGLTTTTALYAFAGDSTSAADARADNTLTAADTVGVIMATHATAGATAAPQVFTTPGYDAASGDGGSRVSAYYNNMGPTGDLGILDVKIGYGTAANVATAAAVFQ